MEPSRFRFSHNRRLGSWQFNHFFERAQEADSIIRGNHPNAESYVLASQKTPAYLASIYSTLFNDTSRRLGSREQIPLDQFDELAWDGALKVQYTAKDATARDPFMMCLSRDSREPGKLFFYGQCIDETTYRDMMRRFSGAGFTFSIGDGMRRPKFTRHVLNV